MSNQGNNFQSPRYGGYQNPKRGGGGGRGGRGGRGRRNGAALSSARLQFHPATRWRTVTVGEDQSFNVRGSYPNEIVTEGETRKRDAVVVTVGGESTVFARQTVVTTKRVGNPIPINGLSHKERFPTAIATAVFNKVISNADDSLDTFMNHCPPRLTLADAVANSHDTPPTNRVWDR